MWKNTDGRNCSYLSHCLRVQLAMIQRDTMKTSSTVPGQMVIKVFRTNRVLKLIRFNAPIEREEASVNNFECKSITLERKNLVLTSKVNLRKFFDRKSKWFCKTFSWLADVHCTTSGENVAYQHNVLFIQRRAEGVSWWLHKEHHEFFSQF